MAYTTGTFGATGEYGITYPSNDEDVRLFAFSPYYIEVTGTAIAQQVTLTFNGFTLTQFTGTDSKCLFPLQKLLQTVFKDVALGDIDGRVVGTHTNTASKLIQKSKDIVVKVGTDTNTKTLTYDIIFGVVQILDSLTYDTINVYKFGDTLPFTLTQLVGVEFNNTPYTWSGASYGKEIFLNGLSDGENIYYTDEFGERIVEVVINNVPDCTKDTMYLRWISPIHGYKYYQFRIGRRTEVSKSGVVFNKNVFSLDPVGEVYPNRSQVISKPTAETITLVEPSADANKIEHIRSIFQSPVVWVYLGTSYDKWQEVNVADSEIQQVWNGGNLELQVNIVMPEKYVLSL